MPKSPGFTPIPQTPLSGPLDTRSRPADLSPGAFRYKLNLDINRTGSLCQGKGHSALSFGQRTDSDTAVNNWDYHRQGSARELATMLFESTSPDSVRRLFLGTQSRVSVLDNDTSEWTDIATGLGDENSRFKMAALEDKVYFTNNVDEPRVHTLGSATSSVIAGLQGEGVTKAKVVVEFNGVILWMNIVEDGDEQSSRIRWSDYRKGDEYAPSVDSVAGFQDLDYGDPILACAQMVNALYIFTERAIWRCVVAPASDTIFAFTRVYVEARNQSACLAYANTLVSTGRELYWWGRDSIWTYNPYIVAPECPDWLLRACGAQFSETDPDRFNRSCCESPVVEYLPDAKEIWWSYPLPGSCINRRCLVINVEYKTGNLKDHGYGAFVNFRRTADSDQACNAAQVFIGSSGSDYCLKSIGGVFYRERVELIDGEVETDIPDDSYSLVQDGYYRRLVGHCPFGYTDKQKTLNNLVLEHDTKDSDVENPNLFTLRIGNSRNLEDPMSTDSRCSVLWNEQDDIEVKCINPTTIAAMKSDGLRPSDPTEWTLFEQGFHLYFDIRITAYNGGAPIGSDSAWNKLEWSVMTD